LKYWFAGREKRLSLGIYPEVSLAEAREKRDRLRAILSEGKDPSDYVKQQRADRLAEEGRQLAATRFSLDNDGALSFRFGNRRLTLTPAETTELRSFLDATRGVSTKESHHALD
jgi:hypothetical protein